MLKSTTFVVAFAAYLAATILVALVFSAEQQRAAHAFTPTTKRASLTFGLTTPPSASMPGLMPVTTTIATSSTSSNTAVFAARKGEGNKQVAKKKKLPFADAGPLAIFGLAAFFVAVDYVFLHIVFNK